MPYVLLLYRVSIYRYVCMYQYSIVLYIVSIYRHMLYIVSIYRHLGMYQ